MFGEEIFIYNDLANNDNLLKDDLVKSFRVGKSKSRGVSIRLGPNFNKITARHRYPILATEALGETLLCAILFGTTLRVKGIVNIQIHGDGPISSVVTEYASDGNLRGYVNFNDKNAVNKLAKSKKPINDIKKLFGESATIVISIDNWNRDDNYQGYIDANGKSIHKCLTNYFKNSDKLDAKISISVGKSSLKGKKIWSCSAAMLYKVPKQSSRRLRLVLGNEDLYDEKQEWLDLKECLENSEEIISDRKSNIDKNLEKLFENHNLSTTNGQKIYSDCKCSREKMKKILVSIPAEDVKELEDKNGNVIIKCQFCSNEESFTDLFK